MGIYKVRIIQNVNAEQSNLTITNIQASSGNQIYRAESPSQSSIKKIVGNFKSFGSVKAKINERKSIPYNENGANIISIFDNYFNIETSQFMFINYIFIIINNNNPAK